MEEESEQEVRVTRESPKTTSTFPPPPQFTHTVTREPQPAPPQNTGPAFTFSAGKNTLGVITVLLSIIGGFFSVVSFSLDHAAPAARLHQYIFSEYNLIITIIIIVGLVFVHFHPQHKWIYYCICATSIIFVLLTLANFILHMCLIDQYDDLASQYSVSVTDPTYLSILKIVKAGAAFTFMDGVFKVLVAVMCIVIIVLKV